MEDKIPFELWLKILSYLPRSYKRKMIGVNRALYEYAMDEVFVKLTLASDDERAIFMITRLQDENVAKRVAHLTIQLCSTSGTHRQSCVEDIGLPPKKTWKNKFFWFLKSKETKMAMGQFHRFSEQWDLNDMFWSFAERNIVLCQNIQVLHLVLDTKVAEASRSFKSFFHSIWLPGSILSGVRKLTIDATAHNLSKFVLSMYRYSNFWRDLENLEINIDPSHKSIVDFLLIQSFLEGLKDKLVTFTLSGHLIPNVANVLRFSPTFSKLRNFEIYSIFNVQSILQVEHLSHFLSTHSGTLEHVLISPQVQAGSTKFNSNFLFLNWLGLSESDFPTTASQGKQTLSSVSLPRLRSLELRYDHQWIDGPIYYRTVFPQLSTIAPNLTALTITQADVSLDRVSQLVSLLPRGQDGECRVESLDLSIEILPPELVDLLSGEMKSLKKLKLRLSRNVVSSDLEQYIYYQIIRERRYPSWTLKHLRIATSSPCGTPHPNSLAMQAVAETLLEPPVLDDSYECQCHLL